MSALSKKQYLHLRNMLYFLADSIPNSSVDMSTYLFRGSSNTKGLRFNIGIDGEDIITLYSFKGNSTYCAFDYEYRGIQHVYSSFSENDKSMELNDILLRLYSVLKHYVSFVVLRFIDEDTKEQFIGRYSSCCGMRKNTENKIKVRNNTNIVSLYTVSFDNDAHKSNIKFVNDLLFNGILLLSDIDDVKELDAYLSGSVDV
jgi:hypothetical protein